MIPLVVVSLFLASGRPLYAAPVTQTSSSDPFPCDAVVLGTNDILELVPATTGLPIPVSTLTNIDIENCGSTAICIEEVFTESASHVVSSALAEFKVLPASIVTAIEDIVNAVEAGVESGRASSNTIDGGLMVSSAAKSTGQIGSNITGSGNLATPVPKSLITYVLEVTNSQSSVTDEVLEVGYHSGVPSTNLLFAYADSVTTTVTSMPSGVSIQTITTSTCTTAGAVVTATSSGTTVTTEVPQLCVLGVAFRIYGLPGFHSSLDLPSLCHRAFSFPLGIIWRLLCPPGLPPRFSIISDDPEKLPPGGGPPGNGPPDQNPNDSNPDGQEPSPTEEPSPTTQNKAPSSAVATSNQQTRSTVPSSAAATSSRTTRSTMSSSAAATPTRYIVYPLMNASQPAIDSLFAPYAQRADVTQAKGSDGLLRYFAVELSDSERSAIDAHSEFLTLQDSLFDIEMPDTGQEDPDLNGASYASEPLDPTPNVGARGLPDKGPRTKGSGLFKRIPLQNWRVKITTWSLAIISLVPGLPFPNYERSDENIYPYYFVNPIDSAPPVRVYAIEYAILLTHYSPFHHDLEAGDYPCLPRHVY